jgi:hypothetical protein
LFTSVVVALTYLRRNRIQAEIGESYGVSQSTISRAVTALTPLLGTTLAPDVPVAEDLSSQAHYIVDGTLLPCWSWAAHPRVTLAGVRLLPHQHPVDLGLPGSPVDDLGQRVRRFASIGSPFPCPGRRIAGPRKV